MATTTLNRTVIAALHADAEAHPHEIAESALFDMILRAEGLQIDGFETDTVTIAHAA
ncbi:MAG: hypothetical protein U0R18_04495 [Mycobacterium sp.]